MIIMSHPDAAAQLQPYFGQNLVVIDPVRPDRVEIEILQYLKRINAQEDAKKALLALGTLALGLLILEPSHPS